MIAMSFSLAACGSSEENEDNGKENVEVEDLDYLYE